MTLRTIAIWAKMEDGTIFHAEGAEAETVWKQIWERFKQPENPALYEVAKEVCHKFGFPWTDPRTGRTYPPPKKRKRKAGKKQ